MSPLVGPRRWLVLAVLFLPLVFTGALVVRYAVDVPVQDEWSLVEDIAKASAGEWGVGDLLRSHNGHRLAIPRLILVGMALATDWRADLPTYLGVVFAAGILGLAWLALRHSDDFLTTLLAAAFIGGLVASPNQWENWLWGVQMHVFLVVLMAVASLVSLSTGRLRWQGFAGAVALALAACLTQGAGLVLWPAGALVLGVRALQTRERRFFALAAAWAATGVLVIAGYLAHIPGDAGAGDPSAWVFRHPVESLRYVGALLGHSLAAWNGAAYPPHDGGVAGVVALLACVVAVPLAVRALRGADPATAVLPLALMVWSVGVSAQIALGRASVGQAGALASRYVTLILPFWLGLALLVFSSGVRWRRPALVVLCALLATSAASEVRKFPQRNRLFVPARRALLTGEDRALLSRLHPEVFQVDAGIPKLKRLKLSVFRAGEPVPIATSLPLREPRQQIDSEAPPTALAAGERRTLRVTVANSGTEGWSSTGDGVGRGWVALGTRWLDGRGQVVAEGPHLRLPRDLAPGATVELRLSLTAPEVPAGTYRVEVSALQEGVAWFPQPALFTVEVRR